MKTISYRYYLALWLALLAFPLHAQILQWERFPIIDSAYDVKVLGLTKTRFGIFTNALSDSLLFSHDRGRSWQKARWKGLGDTAFFPGTQDIPRVLGFQETSTKLFTIISWGYLCFSLDSGKTWEAMRGSIYNTSTTEFLVIDKLLIQDTTFFAIRSGSLYTSRDFGKTWKLFDFFYSADDPRGGYSGFIIENIELEDAVLILSTRSFFGEIRRFISRDKGALWRIDDIPLPAKSEETTLKRLANNLFFAQQRILQKGDVTFKHWLSRDSGKTWQTFSLLGPKDYISGYIVIDSTLFFATTQGIFTTRNKGETWQKESSIGTLPDSEIANFTLDGNTLYVAAYEKGVYRADVSTITSVSSTNNQGFTVYEMPPLFWLSITHKSYSKVWRGLRGREVFFGN